MSGVSLRRTSGSSTTAMFWRPAASAIARRVASSKVRLGSIVVKMSSRIAVTRVGIGGEVGQLLLGERRVFFRRDPVRRPLVDGERADDRRDLGDELHRAGGAADHRDRLTGEVVVVVPTGRVEDRAAEPVEARDVGRDGRTEHAERAHDDVGLDDLAVVADGQAPHRGRRRPIAPARTSVPSRRYGSSPKRSTHVFEVGADLRLSGVGPRPRGIGGERERVEVRLDVALGAGIAVVQPGTADARGLLQDHEVPVAAFEQADAGADASGSGSDDRDTTRAFGFGLVRVVSHVHAPVAAAAATVWRVRSDGFERVMGRRREVRRRSDRRTPRRLR